MKFPKPAVDLEKRERDEPMDTLIKSLLDEEQAVKKHKKDVDEPMQPSRRPGKKTLAEIEAEEGGPIRESMVGAAMTKRAEGRKKVGKGAPADEKDVDFRLNDTERFEENLEAPEEDGIELEPFNLKQEREDGYFDEDGNYVERKRDEDGQDKDAWFGSDEAKVVSEEVRRKIEEKRRQAEEAERQRRAPLTERQIAQRKADMAAVMQPGETVTRALKRLGAAATAAGAGGGATAAGQPHKAMGKRERARLQAQQAATAAAGSNDTQVSEPAEQLRAAFTLLTEHADELLAEGELEIYSETQEALLKAARMWLPNLQQQQGAAGAPAAAPTGTGPATATAAADDDDMFDDDGKQPAAAGAGGTAAVAPPADSDDDMFGEAAAPDAAAKPGSHAAAAQAGVAPSNAAPSQDAEPVSAAAAAGAKPEVASSSADANDGVDYTSWPVKELKRLLQERGVDASSYVEKAELVAKVKEVVAAGQPATAGQGTADAFTAPAGYAFDPSTGYFYNSDKGMYYDTATGYYGQAVTGKWFYLDSANNTFVDVNTQH